MLLDFPSLPDAEMAKNELDRLERTVPIVVCDPHPRITESDYVPSFVTGQIGNETRMLIGLPSLSNSKVVDDDVYGPKSTISFVQRNVYSSGTATNDVNLPITGQVCDEAGVLLDEPATCFVAEVVDDGLRRREGSISVIAANVDLTVAKSYDIWKAVSGDVAEEAQVTVETPTLRITERVERDVRGIELRIAVVS